MHLAGTALHSASCRLLARAESTWVAIDPATFGAAPSRMTDGAPAPVRASVPMSTPTPESYSGTAAVGAPGPAPAHGHGRATNVRASSPPLTLLGSLDGIEAGLRQLRRTRPLEIQELTVGDDARVRVPTLAEMLRVKAYLVVQRNQVRDYLDTVALADRLGTVEAARVLLGLDDYYADRSADDDSVLTALVQRLSEPDPRDRRVTGQLGTYKGLAERWHTWPTVVSAAQALADAVVEELEGR
ncbi:MAG: hypothetical protein ACRCSN_18620 [Dermatophilaceae bacterium]